MNSPDVKGRHRDAAGSQPPDVVVRQAEAGEMSTVRALFEEYAAWLGIDLDFQDFAHELATLPGDYAEPTGVILLAVCDGDVAGCVALRPLGDGPCEMKRLFVRSRFRGRGIGRALATAILEEGRRRRYAAMRLDTLPQMKEAMAMYESLGFRAIAPYRQNPIEGARFLERDLTNPA